MTGSSREDLIRRRFEEAAQGHVFRWFDELSETQQDAFLTQLESVDLALLGRLISDVQKDAPVASIDLERIEPAPYIPVVDRPGARRKANRAARVGEELLRAGKVAAFIVAGGQGSRLGYDGPKGCFEIGPSSGRTLFDWHFEKVVATRRRYAAEIAVLVMTSDANHAETEAYLSARDWYGLPKQDVILFRQGMLPAVDVRGRLILGRKDSLFMSPDGHGGSLAALVQSGALDQLESRGVEEIFYFQVDNPLARVLDPAFLGHHRIGRADVSSKMVLKRHASEKVGVFARAGRKLGVVEYSDLPDDLSAATDEAGNLVYRAGNIAIHALSAAFVRRLTAGGLRLPYHRANKEVPFVDDEGRVVEPTDKNGVKFETFVFDAIPLAKRSLIVEAERAHEFSPVKNRTGADSVETARADMSRFFRSWVEAAGFELEHEEPVLEISPLFALDAEEFVRRVRKEKRLPGRGLVFS